MVEFSLSLSLFSLSLSLAVPQFGLISQVSSLRLPLRAFRPPCSAPACWWWMQVLGVAIRLVICGFYLFISPPSYVALCDSKTPHRPAIEIVSWCLETSSLLRLSSWEWISIPTSFVSLFTYLLSKTMGCLCGCLMSSAIIQKLFCGIFSAIKCSFNGFAGEKVVSLSYPTAILGPPPKE